MTGVEGYLLDQPGRRVRHQLLALVATFGAFLAVTAFFLLVPPGRPDIPSDWAAHASAEWSLRYPSDWRAQRYEGRCQTDEGGGLIGRTGVLVTNADRRFDRPPLADGAERCQAWDLRGDRTDSLVMLEVAPYPTFFEDFHEVLGVPEEEAVGLPLRLADAAAYEELPEERFGQPQPMYRLVAEIEGKRFFVEVHIGEKVSEEDLEALDLVLASIEFTPRQG